MKTKQETHTPTLWTSREARSLPWHITSLAILNKDKNCVVLRPSATPDKKINQRMFNDSEFIVRAVNSHQALIEATKKLLHTMTLENIKENGKTIMETLRFAERVIIEAEGE